MNIDQAINDAVTPVANFLASIVFADLGTIASTITGLLVMLANVKLVVLLLFGGAVAATIYFKGINIRGIPQALKSIRRGKDKTAQGEIGHFQASTAALSGTVGLGNIAGVAVALTYGGPGAAFWMTVAGLFGMALKFTESTLGNKYRTIAKDGTVLGGAMYYISAGLKERGLESAGKILASAFALFCFVGAIGAGNMFQVNQAHTLVVGISGGENSFFYNRGWLFGLIVAVLLGMIIIYGVKGIVRVTEKMVPLMAGIYILGALAVILVNWQHIGAAFATIITEAFYPKAGVGGAIGVMIWGFQRAIFSNEAGLGTAPAVYAAVQTKNPLSAGHLSLLEPFIDTVIICNLTALVLVVSGVDLGSGLGGVEVTSAAFATVFSWFPYVLAVAGVLFAFSTMLTWSYYGLQSWNYLFTGHSKMEPTSGNFYKILFCSFAVVGATTELSAIVTIADSMIFLMLIPNLVALYLLAPKVKQLLRSNPLD